MSWIRKANALSKIIPVKYCRNYHNNSRTVKELNCWKCSTRAFSSLGHVKNLPKKGFSQDIQLYRCCDQAFSASALSQSVDPPTPTTAPYTQFANEENKNADQFLRNSKDYKSTLFLNNNTGVANASSSTFHTSVKRFIDMALSPEHTQYALASDVNKEVVEEVLSNLKSLPDEDLRQVLYHARFFAPSTSAKEPEYVRIWSALDAECASRMSTWTFDENFTVADLWNGLYLSRLSNFHWNFVKRCFRKCDRLSKEHFIRFMFCLNLTRRIPDSITTFDLEFNLNRLVDQLSWQEVAIVAMAFFKTETVIKDGKVFEKLLDIFVKDAATADSISVAAVAKLARFSSFQHNRDILLRFQEAFFPEIERLSIPACTHLALIGTKCQIPHFELINTVVKKIEGLVKVARLKELERICLAMTMFNTDCDKLCNLIVDELRSAERADEIRSYGRCLPAVLHYLSLREIFPEDLISIALGEGFRNTYYGKKWDSYQRELLCLDFTAELEIKDYKRNRLNSKTREKLLKMNVLRLAPPSREKVSEYQKAIRKVVKAVEVSIGGPEYVHPCTILPQHHAVGVVYCTDIDGNFAKVPDEYRRKKDYEIKYIPKDQNDIQYRVVFLSSRNTELEGCQSLSGQGQYQIRQLQKMGYEVHTAFVSDYADENARINLINRVFGLKNSSKKPDDSAASHPHTTQSMPLLNQVVNAL